MNNNKGKDASMEELAPNFGRPTRTMLNPYKNPKDWIDTLKKSSGTDLSQHNIYNHLLVIFSII